MPFPPETARFRFIVSRLCRALVLLMTVHTALASDSDANRDPSHDPHLWLEEVQGDAPLAWVRERNAASRQRLEAWPDFQPLRAQLRAILDSRDRIPTVVRRDEHLYNFWQDAEHPRGLWRRTSLAQYRQAAPAWETVLDLDALARQEGENWVWGGAECLGPAYRRCLLKLSRGGADATVVREFDLVERRFVDGGFTLPEAKTDVEWIDEDTVYVGTDFGPGSMTDSGYPRVIRRWQRGQPLFAAVTVFEGQPSDVSAGVRVDRTPGWERTVFVRATDFWNSEQFLLEGGALRPVPKPRDARLVFWRDQALLWLRSDWTVGGQTWPGGSLLAVDAGALMASGGSQAPEPPLALTALFTPTATRSLADFDLTPSTVLLSVLDQVAGRLEEMRRDGPRWVRREVSAPHPGTLAVQSLHDPLLRKDTMAEHYLLSYTDFLTPDSLALGTVGSDAREPLKSRPAFFDAAGMRVEQLVARSADGTAVPYFVVWPRGAKADGGNPTLMYGYGGFDVSLQPWYSAAYGAAWYGRGGVLVVANIRGGGEFGPAWHQAAIGANKQRSYDDFIAVAQDLVARGITQPQRLGVMGGSNGGLLVGAVMLQRPELFGAVVSSVPLLDMRRYHRLLAGASWMAEYGDPDRPEDWAWISRYSPYQNVRTGQKLPPVLFTTSTRDDRVHPGHARKMVARMVEQGHRVLYYENIEGGHGGAADNAQRADLLALEFAFLWQVLGGGGGR